MATNSLVGSPTPGGQSEGLLTLLACVAGLNLPSDRILFRTFIIDKLVIDRYQTNILVSKLISSMDVNNSHIFMTHVPIS